MSDHAAFDAARFAKVKAMHDGTTHAGERAAAASRMEAMARSAGMTVEDALSKLDKTHASSAFGANASTSWFDDFLREGRAERERERSERWREVLDEYGTEEAVFEPGPWERALEQACERFTVRLETTGWPIGSLWGWNGSSVKEPAPEIVAAVEAAYPMPASVREAWVEFMFWDKLGRDREARGTGCGDRSPPVALREQLIERLLDTMPALSLNDLRARMSWMEWRNDTENAPDPEEERVRLATLRADIERMGRRIREQDADAATDPIKSGQCTAPLGEGQCGRSDEIDAVSGVQSGQDEGGGVSPPPQYRTTAERRAAVLELLRSPADTTLSDREIARRVGVSPQTVGNLRRKGT